MRNLELLEKIDAAIAEKSLLKHPFYQDWQAGKLSRESLQLYAAQYYRHVDAFPKHLRVLAARTEGPIRDIVLENLAEEENPSQPHPKLSACSRKIFRAAPRCRARKLWSRNSRRSSGTVPCQKRLRRCTPMKLRCRKSRPPRSMA